MPPGAARAAFSALALTFSVGCTPGGSTRAPKVATSAPLDGVEAKRERCMAGAAEACTSLAEGYASGRLQAPPRRRFARLARRVCGTSYPVDPAACLAMAFHARACDLGTAKGCVAYAAAVRKAGRRGAEPRARASERRACAGGHGPSCHRLGERAAAAGRGPHHQRRAADRFQQGCAADHGPSCTALAWRLARGLGRRPSPRDAARHYLHACEQGDAHGCYALARTRDRPTAKPRRLRRAAQLYRSACGHDVAAACVALADLEGSRRLGKPRPETAARLYARAATLWRGACTDGDAAACTGMGTLLRTGRGVAQDAPAGRKLQDRACRAGHAAACTALFDEGGVAQPVPTGHPAPRVWRSACAAGDADACFAAGQPRGKHRTQNFLLALGCRRGHAQACNARGVGGFFPPRRGDRRALERGCALGSPAACTHLARTLQGASTAPPARSRELLNQACKDGLGEACTALAQVYGRSLGVALDRGRAEALLARGCKHGDGAACRRQALARRVGAATGGSSADELLARGCALGDRASCVTVAAIALQRARGGPGANRALASLRQHCDAGDADGCVTLGEALAHEEAPGHEPSEAKRRLREGARLAGRSCQRAVTVCRKGREARVPSRWRAVHGRATRFWDGVPSCGVSAEQPCRLQMRALSGACVAGDAGACTSGLALRDQLRRQSLDLGREAVTALERGALRGWEKDCKSGVAQACFDAADAHAAGRGTKKRAARAKTWRRRGCRLDPKRCATKR